MNPSTEAKTGTLTDLHTINLGYSGFSSDQERWAFLGSLRDYLAASESAEACGQMGFTDNATGTSIASTVVPVKIAGTTTAGILSGFSHSNGRLTLTAASARVGITATVSISNGNNDQLAIFIAKNGAVVQASKSAHTSDTGSHIEMVTSQALLDLVSGDFVECFALNGSTLTTVSITQFSMIVK